MKVQVIAVENGIKWVEINGTDYGTGREFNSDIYGIKISDGTIYDCDGTPITDGDYQTVKNYAENI